jgi:hypothetical protein
MTFAARPFTEHMVADALRLPLIFMGLCLIALCLRVAILRAQSPRGSALRDRSPFALLSYALFALIPTLEFAETFGRPLDARRAVLYALALGCGVLAAFAQVTVRLWMRRQPGAHRADGVAGA